jgi:hypothetical protein
VSTGHSPDAARSLASASNLPSRKIVLHVWRLDIYMGYEQFRRRQPCCATRLVGISGRQSQQATRNRDRAHSRNRAGRSLQGIQCNAGRAEAHHRIEHEPSLTTGGHPARLLDVQSALGNSGNTRPGQTRGGSAVENSVTSNSLLGMSPRESAGQFKVERRARIRSQIAASQ